MPRQVNFCCIKYSDLQETAIVTCRELLSIDTLKILHVNNEKTWRGGEQQTLLLALALNSNSFRNTIACRKSSPLETKARSKGIKIVSLWKSFVCASFQLAFAARSVDLIHCHTGRAHSLAAMTTLIHRKPIVVTRRVAFIPKDTWFNRYKYNVSQLVITVSRYIADELQKWGIPKNKLVVIHDAIQPDLVQNQDRAKKLLKDLGISDQSIIVGNIAALTSEKDHVTLLQAIKTVVDTIPDIHIIIIGDGQMKENLMKLKTNLGLDQTVHFLGYLDNPEEVLSIFNVFVLSSKTEGLASTILEAFRAKIPVVATAAGGIPELVINNETGLLVQPEDYLALAKALIRAIKNRPKTEAMTATAYKITIEKFSLDHMAAEYHKIYKSIIFD